MEKWARTISGLALQDPDFEIIHAYTIPESPNMGMDIGLLANSKSNGVEIVDTDFFESDCETSPPDVVMDFTAPEGTQKNAFIAVPLNIPMVIGTTGLSKEFTEQLQEACEQSQCAVVKATNMAMGVNIFFKIAAEIASYVKDWDIEIIEAHHHNKKDAPSGTALTTAEKIAEVLERNLDEIAKYGRDKGPNPRKFGADEIGIHAIPSRRHRGRPYSHLCGTW